jgi:hypothetical protein
MLYIDIFFPRYLLSFSDLFDFRMWVHLNLFLICALPFRLAFDSQGKTAHRDKQNVKLQLIHFVSRTMIR